MNTDLLGSAFSTAAIEPLLDARAWVQAMLDFEAALARAQARVGVIPAEAAAAIAAACQADRIDLAQIREQTVNGGNPAIPLIKQLTAAVAGEAAGYVHWGATSQDVIDTALMLVVRQATAQLVPRFRPSGERRHERRERLSPTLRAQGPLDCNGRKRAAFRQGSP